MTFEDALVRTVRLREILETLSRHENRQVAERALADKVAVEIMVAWARRAYAQGFDDVAVDMINVVHGV